MRSPSPRSRSRSFWRTAALACVVSFASSLSLADAKDWEVLRKDDGIRTAKREQPGAELPAFRAEATLPGSVWEVVAVLEDVQRACDWTSHCDSMRQLKRYSELDRLVYARIAAPWPVQDRDVVTRVKAEYGNDGNLLLSIRGDGYERTARRDHAIRMPRFSALYRFSAQGPHRTWTVYEIDVDPGGSLPDWLKRHIARDFPHDTLAKLRSRVRWARAQGLYAQRVAALTATAKADGFVAWPPAGKKLAQNVGR